MLNVSTSFFGEIMKKVLMVAYSFPPVGGAGVQRPIKFVKYLREFGWEPVVLTVKNPSVPVVDESLLKDIPEGVKIYKARTFEPSYQTKKGYTDSKKGLLSPVKSIVKKLVANLLLPDVQVLWWPALTMKLVSIIRYEKPDCLFVTAPPFSSFVPVVLIGRLFRVPVVVDFRDEWSFSRQNWENAQKNIFSNFIDVVMERTVVMNTTAITVASPYYQTSLEKQYPFALHKVHTITNGYDPDDFVDVDFSKSNKLDSDYFTIVYTGTIWRATSLEPFLRGVSELVETAPDIIAKIKLRIIGRIVEEEINILESLRELISVETVDYLPHEKIFPEMTSADLLLLTLSDLPGAEKIIPGKTFEYLAAKKSILAVIPSGVTSELIEDETNVFIVDPSNHGRISEILIKIVGNNMIGSTREGIEKYSRSNLTIKLCDVFNNICQ